MKSISFMRLLALLAITSLFSVSTLAAGPVVGKSYVLSNSWLKEGKVLSLDSKNRLFMAPVKAGDLRQKWKFTKGPNGALYMHNEHLGLSKAVDSNAQRPDIRSKGRYTGQFWRFTADGAWYRISNDFQGVNRVLDTYNQPGNYVFFEAKARKTSGTYWKFKEAESQKVISTLVTTTQTIDLGNATNNSNVSGPSVVNGVVVLPWDGKPVHVSGCEDNFCKENAHARVNHSPLLPRGSRCSGVVKKRSKHLPEVLVLDGMDCTTVSGIEQYKKVNDWFLDYEKNQSRYKHYSQVVDHLSNLIKSPLDANTTAVLEWLLKAASSLKGSVTRQAHAEYDRWITFNCAYEVIGPNYISRENFYNDYHCSGKQLMKRSSLELLLHETTGSPWKSPTVKQFKQVVFWSMADNHRIFSKLGQPYSYKRTSQKPNKAILGVRSTMTKELTMTASADARSGDELARDVKLKAVGKATGLKADYQRLWANDNDRAVWHSAFLLSVDGFK